MLAVHEQIWTLIGDCSIATLISLERSDRLRAWAMLAVPTEFEGNLWFLVANDSPAVASIEANPEVCLVYAHPRHADFISVYGSSLVVTNIAKKQQLWSPKAQARFPEGPASGTVVAVRVAVDYAEHWNSQNNKVIRVAVRHHVRQDAIHIQPSLQLAG